MAEKLLITVRRGWMKLHGVFEISVCSNLFTTDLFMTCVCEWTNNDVDQIRNTHTHEILWGSGASFLKTRCTHLRVCKLLSIFQWKQPMQFRSTFGFWWSSMMHLQHWATLRHHCEWSRDLYDEYVCNPVVSTKGFIITPLFLDWTKSCPVHIDYIHKVYTPPPPLSITYILYIQGASSEKLVLFGRCLCHT